MAKYGPIQQVLFDHRVIWGGNPPDYWTDGTYKVSHTYRIIDPPWNDLSLAQYRANQPLYTPNPGRDYTGAWWFRAVIEWQAYVRDDEVGHESDHDVYIDVKVKPIRHHVWASTAEPLGGFNDIGAIYVNDFSNGIANSSLRIPPMNQAGTARGPSNSWQRDYGEAQQLGMDDLFTMGSMDHARKQLESAILSQYTTWNEDWSSYGQAQWLVGCILDNGSRLAWCLLPTSNPLYYETTASGDIEGSQVNGEYWEISKTFVYPPEAFDSTTGKFKSEWSQLPFYTAGRSVHWPDHDDPDTEYVLLSLQALFSFNLDDPGSLFNYIPWAILEDASQDQWATCNRPSRDPSEYSGDPYNDGLQVRKGSRWENHYVWNNSMNPMPSGDSNGFRVQSGDWIVSPKTP